MAKDRSEKKRKHPILLFLFAIVFPLILVFILAWFTLPLVGIDMPGWVQQKTENVPILSSIVPSKEEKDLERKLETAQQTIDAQREELDELRLEIDSMEAIIDELERENERLRESAREAEEDETSETTVDEVKKAAASFRKMDPEKAAPIIENLEENIAVEILSRVSGDVRGNILAEMEPNQAARLTELLASQ